MTTGIGSGDMATPIHKLVELLSGVRTLSALILILLTAIAIHFAPAGMLVFLTLSTILMAFEWTYLCKITLRRRSGMAIIGSVFSAMLITCFGHLYFAAGLLFLLSSLCIFTGWLTYRTGFFWLALGIVYIGLPIVFCLWIFLRFPNPDIFFAWLMLIVSFNDMGAYVLGSLIGGPKLAPSISPNKTWAGFFGGLACSMFAAWIFTFYQSLSTRFWLYLSVSAFLAVCATCGDLFESIVKRVHGVKSSGSIIPGHGGIFDRLDGFLLVLPIVFVLHIFYPQVLDLFAIESSVLQTIPETLE